MATHPASDRCVPKHNALTTIIHQKYSKTRNIVSKHISSLCLLGKSSPYQRSSGLYHMPDKEMDKAKSTIVLYMDSVYANSKVFFVVFFLGDRTIWVLLTLDFMVRATTNTVYFVLHQLFHKSSSCNSHVDDLYVSIQPMEVYVPAGDMPQINLKSLLKGRYLTLHGKAMLQQMRVKR